MGVDWDLHAHVWLLIPSVGYVLYDLFFGVLRKFHAWEACCGEDAALFNNPSSVILATLYLIDSVLYAVSLRAYSKELFGRPAFWLAELLNVAGSVAFLISQALQFLPGDTLSMWLQVLSYFVANLIWGINGFQYLYTYVLTKEPGPIIRDLYFHGELYNTIGSVGYVFTSAWPLVLLPSWLQSGENTAAELVAANAVEQLLVNVLWDLLLSASAICFLVQHLRDKKAEKDSLREISQNSEVSLLLSKEQEKDDDEDK